MRYDTEKKKKKKKKEELIIFCTTKTFSFIYFKLDKEKNNLGLMYVIRRVNKLSKGKKATEKLSKE